MYPKFRPQVFHMLPPRLVIVIILISTNLTDLHLAVSSVKLVYSPVQQILSKFCTIAGRTPPLDALSHPITLTPSFSL
jgi:hypothetical protein